MARLSQEEVEAIRAQSIADAVCDERVHPVGTYEYRQQIAALLADRDTMMEVGTVKEVALLYFNWLDLTCSANYKKLAVDRLADTIRNLLVQERRMSVTVCSNYNVMKKQLGSAESPDAANLAETFRSMLAELSTPAPGVGVK